MSKKSCSRDAHWATSCGLLQGSAISRAVAKAIAYHNAGKQEQADRWVAELVRLLGAKGILSREAIDLQPDG
jgi:hypothetical protein